MLFRSNICTKEGLVGRSEENGTIVDLKPIDVGYLFAQPTT